MGSRIGRRESHAFAEERQRFLMIEVVGQRFGPGHELVSRVLRGAQQIGDEWKDGQ
jgi:hypothetical protein